MTGEGVLELGIVQLEGKRELPVEEFVRGRRDFLARTLGVKLTWRSKDDDTTCAAAYQLGPLTLKNRSSWRPSPLSMPACEESQRPHPARTMSARAHAVESASSSWKLPMWNRGVRRSPISWHLR
jgi:hypothetical protein